MGRQSRLVILLVICLGLLQVSHSSTPRPAIKLIHDDVLDNELDSGEVAPKTGPKISTPKAQELPVDAITKSAPKSEASTVATHTVSDETLKDLLEASKHNAALAEDPRLNKLLKADKKNSTSSEEDYEDNYEGYDYEEDDEIYNESDYDEDKTTARPKKNKSSTPSPKLHAIQDEKLKSKPKGKESKTVDVKDKENNIDNDSDYEYDDEDDDDDDEESDTIADEEEVVFSENVPCPRYCVCSRNINSYLVATCRRLDPGTQKFGSDITDLVVTNVGPKYPILLSSKFFHSLGLKFVASIKIANCTIEYMHHEAFHGLEELYAVNLTNVGLTVINPDTFAQNKKLRMLTISGNDLNVMSSLHYLLKSSSIEELDFSRNNLVDLNPLAFSQLSNIVYINLAQNNLKKLPEKVFDSVETIEELDLSYNSLKDLPVDIFNRTALAILHLKYNSFSGNLNFGVGDLQQLDLSFNSISQVHHGMFDKMTGLTNLNLKGNGITKIQPDSFLTLKNLRHIDLSINELDQISSMVFFKNSELDVIRLNDNPKLTQLPTDGFLSYNGYFTVYYLDISNCAIGALGHKTFSTMPHLTTLKLAWNNINNLPRDTFASLTKLIDLDLNNNLIVNLDELMFMENNELTKLNLAGNPINKLSVRLFMPLHQLRSLDVSDCELTALMSDKQFGVGYKFFDTLRSFNASGNLIKRISAADIKSFKNLRSLDITNNPLKCNDDFQDFIRYVSLHTHTLPEKTPLLANLEDDSNTLVEIESQAGWSQLAHKVCKHQESKEEEEEALEKRLDEASKKLDEDKKKLSTLDKEKMKKIMKGHSNPELPEAESAEEDLNNGGEDKDDEEAADGDDDDVDEDDEDDDDDSDDADGHDDDDTDNDKKDKATTIDSDFVKYIETELKPKLKDHGIKVEEIDMSQERRDKFLLEKLGYESNESNGDDEEIIIERGHIYYTGYKFMIPIIIVVTCLVVILLAIAKVVTLVLRKRGERYRMALQASKNSFVYQKLTEDIVKPTIKEPKQPKVHRYAPINQV